MLKRIGGLLIVIMIMAAFVPTTQAQGYCYGAMIPRLQVGAQGRVTPGLPNVLRSQPYRGYDSVVLGEIPAGGVFEVLGGPGCYEGMYWWQVRYNGQVGWTPEGSNGGVYWTEPYVVIDPYCNVPTRLMQGQQARVVNDFYLGGQFNALRSQPSADSSSAILAWLPAGSMLSVLPESTCINNVNWHRVSYFNMTGWAVESVVNEYWLEPFGFVPNPPTPTPVSSCPLTPNLLSGYTGIVRAGLPNRLRAQASTNSTILASMQADDTFTVIQGPVCAQGMNWWQVNYRGMIGWSAEGQNGQYWLDRVMCPGFQPSWISVGRYATVTPGLPNRLRSRASTYSQVLGLIPAGAQVDVIGGPICGENAAWWRVNYRGVIGWTMEGQGNDVWLSPVN